MTRHHACVIALAVVTPLAVDLPGGEDSTSAAPHGLRLRASGGLASYTFFARGCEGQVLDHVPVRAHDAAVSIEQDLGSSPVTIGVRGGWTRDAIDTTSSGLFPEVPLGRTLRNRYVNPYIALETQEIGIGGGPVCHDHGFPTADEYARLDTLHSLNDFSAHLRLGREVRPHFIVRWMESEPLYSGGGYLTLGVGGPLRNSGSCEVGLAAGGPYEGAGVFLKTRWYLNSTLDLDVNGRIGNGGTGASLGLGYRWPARTRATSAP
jgi:hypothetical protein